MIRDKQIIAHYKRGWLLRQIGQKYNLSRERIRQIVKEQGVASSEGGALLQRKIEKPIHEAKLAAKKLKNKTRRVKKDWGCSLELYEKLGGNSYQNTIIRKFHLLRHQIRNKGGKWNLTLEEWWEIWEKSGKYNQHGLKKHQFVMARINKKGPISKINVRIIRAKDSKNLAA